MTYPVKVSVILPTYNRERLLPRTIRSILRQTMPDFELLIIDDASTDGTETLVRSYQDDRIRYIKRTVNHLELYHRTGERDNPRNDGLKQARGQYVAYIDSDDIWRTNFLEKMTRFLDRRPEVDFAYSDAIWHRHLKGEEEMANCNLSADFGPKIIRIRNIIRTLTVMHKREIIDKIGWFNPVWVKCPHPGVDYVGIEDWDYWFRVSEHFKIKHYPELLSHKINNTSDHYDDPDYDPEFEKPVILDSNEVFRTNNIFRQIDLIREFSELSEKLMAVEGYLQPEEGYALYQLAANGAGMGEIVEIGSFLGRSTCWLALGAMRKNREKVTAVDHFKGSREHKPGKKFGCAVLAEEGTTYNRFIDNLKKMGVFDQVQPIVGRSEETVRTWEKPIRLLFIDGDHGYEATAGDFEAWSKFLVPGGYVAFHDVATWPGVTQFYKELMASTKEYEEVAAVTSLRVIRRKAE